MNLAANAPLDETALAAALDFGKQLPMLLQGQSLTHLYLHWRVSGYTGGCCDYNALISLRVKENRWVGNIQADPRLNATEPPQDGYAAHTYLRNSHAFGLSVDAMDEATPSDFGPDPITLHEIETMLACAATIALKYHIDAADPTLVMTHGEAAILDGYFVTDSPGDGITRWDLARLSASSLPLTKAECVETGNLLRARIHVYKLHLMNAS